MRWEKIMEEYIEQKRGCGAANVARLELERFTCVETDVDLRELNNTIKLWINLYSSSV